MDVGPGEIKPWCIYTHLNTVSVSATAIQYAEHSSAALSRMQSKQITGLGSKANPLKVNNREKKMSRSKSIECGNGREREGKRD